MRNIHQLPLVRTPTSTKPTTQACALTKHQTCDILFCGMMPNQLSHTSQGCTWFEEEVQLRSFAGAYPLVPGPFVVLSSLSGFSIWHIYTHTYHITYISHNTYTCTCYMVFQFLIPFPSPSQLVDIHSFIMCLLIAHVTALIIYYFYHFMNKAMDINSISFYVPLF